MLPDYTSENVLLAMQSYAPTDWKSWSDDLETEGAALAFSSRWNVPQRFLDVLAEMDNDMETVGSIGMDRIERALLAGKGIDIGAEIYDSGSGDKPAIAFIINLKFHGLDPVVSFKIKHSTE